MPGPWSIGGAKRRRLRRESPARSTGSELRSGDGKGLNLGKAAPPAASSNHPPGPADRPSRPNGMGVSMSSARMESLGFRIGV